MLTKEQLTDAHEQGLSVILNGRKIQIVAIIMDVVAVKSLDSDKIIWLHLDSFFKGECIIEQPKPKIDFSILKEGNIYYLKSDKSSYLIKFLYSQLKDIEIIWDCNYALRNNCIYREINGIKGSFITELRLPTESELELFYSKFPDLKPKPKYNGRAVKCDTVEQANWLLKVTNFDYELTDNNYLVKIDGGFCSEIYAIRSNYEIISFSDYCKENGIKEPKWIQGFEIRGGYNDVVMVSSDNINWHCHLLTSVNNKAYPFHSKSGGSWSYCRYPKRNEINEIKFID